MALALTMLGLASLLATPAFAQDGDGSGDDRRVSLPAVAVVEVDGLFDPVLTDFVEDTIAEAEADRGLAVVLQLNSSGVVIPESDFMALAEVITDSTVPVAVWIGPSGSSATRGAAELAGVSALVGMAPGTRLGDVGTPMLPAGSYQRDFRRALDRLETGTVNTDEAVELGIAVDAPTLGDFLLHLEGFDSKVVGEGEDQRREPVTPVRLGQLPLLSQLMHTVASPPVAYLLFISGIAILIFELFVAGVGVAGVVGAGCVILGCYGLAVLPTNAWAIGLLVFAMFGFAVDVQTGVPRVWTGIAMASLAVGSLFLYTGEQGVSLSWVTWVIGLVAMALVFFSGMPSMVRTRFSTPTIGREWMIGEMGRAVTDVDPNGTVRVRDALWRATTNRATPITELDRVRVVGIDGLVLEVEPEEGGARDYRDRG